MSGPGPKKSTPSIDWLKTQSRAAKGWIMLAIGAGVTSGVLLLAQAHLIARAVHATFMEDGPELATIPLVAMLVAIVATRAGLVWCRTQAGFHAGATVRRNIRRSLMRHLMASGPVAANQLPAGQLVSTVFDHVEAVHDFVAHYLPQLALAALLPLVILGFVFPISWAVGGILLITAPLIPLFMILVGMGAESISQRHFKALARMSAHFLDVLKGLPTLKLFGRSHAQAKQIAAISSDYRRTTMSVLRVAFLSSAVLEFFSAIAIALAAVFLGMAYLGYVDFGTYGTPISFASGFFILLLAPDFFLPLRELGRHYHARADAVGASEEIMNVLERLRAPLPEGHTTIEAPNAIVMEHVTHHYNDRHHPALDRLDFTIGKGQRIAVVGPSGAGKSTLLHLLLGFIAPQDGTIRVNGKPLDRNGIVALRQHCAWVGQSPMLFSGTIRENIAMANPGATAADIAQAASLAGVTRFSTALPQGLDTRIGEQGLGLSAGQAQRVALARAMVRGATLLLLDEPTANLDKRTEADIVADLKRWPAECAMIIATHRAAPLTLAEHIIVLQEGRCVAQGSHAQLLQTDAKRLPGFNSTA